MMTQADEGTVQHGLEVALLAQIDDSLRKMKNASYGAADRASLASVAADCAYTLAIIQGRDVSKP